MAYDRVWPLARVASVSSSGMASAAVELMPTATMAPATVRNVSRRNLRRLLGTKQSASSQFGWGFAAFVITRFYARGAKAFPVSCRDQSARKAETGSILDARQAGARLASSAIPTRLAPTWAMIHGSLG